MAYLKLDHLAVAAGTLAEGVEYVEDSLGVLLAKGGVHPLMGTHNRLLNLGAGVYLEVIAIDPDAPTPDHPRWFDLDNFSGAPRLTNWIARTKNLAQMLRAAPEDAGQSVTLSRGDLRWDMAIPQNGKLPFGGGYPALIQWHDGAHPTQHLPDAGCHLTRFDILHPKSDQLAKVLAPVLKEPGVAILKAKKMSFRAEMETPNGLRTLT